LLFFLDYFVGLHPAPLVFTMVTVAYQGEPGAYSESAALQFFSSTGGSGGDGRGASVPRPSDVPHINTMPTPSFKAMLAALTSSTATHAAMPIENSLAGTIHPNLDLLLANPLVSIVGETDFRVRHCLLGLADAPPGVSLKRVHSHYMALAQCTGYLADRGLTQVVAADTAGAARALSRGKLVTAGDRGGVHGEDAVLASRRAGDIYGLAVLDEGVEDDQGNYTRFLILAMKRVDSTDSADSGGITNVPRSVGIDGAVKTSVAFTLRNVAGELFRALSVFAVSGADLTKVESRHVATLRQLSEGANGSGAAPLQATPRGDEDGGKGGDKEAATSDNSNGIGSVDGRDVERRWGYIFYVDVAHEAGDKGLQIALRALSNAALFFRVLGTYPRCGP